MRTRTQPPAPRFDKRGMQPVVYVSESYLIAVRVGPLVLSVTEDRARWHRVDAWGPWWRVSVGHA